MRAGILLVGLACLATPALAKDVVPAEAPESPSEEPPWAVGVSDEAKRAALLEFEKGT